MKTEEKIDWAMEWLHQQDVCTVKAVAIELLKYAVVTEWISMWPTDQLFEMLKEEMEKYEGADAGKYMMEVITHLNKPYLTSCGEPIV